MADWPAKESNTYWCSAFYARAGRSTPEQFVERVLRDGLRARSVIVGDNFRFGASRPAM